MKSKKLFTNHHQTVVIENGANVAITATLGCFVQVSCDAQIGSEVLVEGLVIVPSNVHIDAQAHVSCGVCFLTPVSKAKPTVIGRGAILGANAIIHSGVTIGAGAVVAPGTQIVRSVPAMAIVEGAPARIVGYVGASLDALVPIDSTADPIHSSSVCGVSLRQMPRVIDIRGNLTVGEFDRSIPFVAKRYFIVFDVPSFETRGEHAHRECHQFLICVRGSCSVVADDGKHKQEFLLNRPDVGLHLCPMVWGIQYKYSSDAVLLVYASHYYDSEDYIRSYSEFCELVKAKV